jgi:oligopeptide transport system substrate-binding protein
MNNQSKYLYICIVFTLLVTACSQKTAETIQPTTIATSQDHEWAMRPTATAFAPVETGMGEFYDPNTGIRLTYPTNWITEPGEDVYTLGYFYSTNGEIFMTLYDDSEYYGDIQETTLQNFNYFTEGLTNIQVLSDEPITFDSGTQGWIVTGLATLDDGTELEISITTLQSGSVVALLLTGAYPVDYEDRIEDILNVIRSMRVEDTAMNGIPRSQSLVLSGGESTNSRDYDPATISSSSGDHLTFSGLVALDRDLNLIPDLAESWDVNDDGTIYTFHLRENARFHNGRPVTSGDVIYSWDRAANPETESDTVLTYLGDIIGVKERHDGSANEISGLKAIDDKTIQVSIDAAKPYFLYKLTYPTAFVVDKANVESGSEWYRTPNGTGPYRLARWDRFKLKILERNDDYYLELPSIRFIVVKIFTGDELRLYESGDIDVAGVSLYDLDRILDPNEPLNEDLISDVSLCTDYINFDTTKPPFDDVNVRQAFSMAFDRQKYMDVVLLGKSLPAEGLYPPALPGYDVNIEGLPYDPGKARELLAISKYGGAENLPAITFTTSGYGSDVDSQTSALAQMWKQNLGVEIIIENLQPDVYYDEIKTGNYGQLLSNGWCADYPDPENFADVLFHTGAESNESKYSNAELDALLDKARVEVDASKRIEMYQQAERIIINDAPVLFLNHPIFHVLVKPRVKGYVLTPISIALERYLTLEGE